MQRIHSHSMHRLVSLQLNDKISTRFVSTHQRKRRNFGGGVLKVEFLMAVEESTNIVATQYALGACIVALQHA